MNAKQLKRDLRRLAQREVPREPDLWPAVHARIAPFAGGNDARVGDTPSTYVWRADAASRPGRWRSGARVAGAVVAVALLVVVLAALFNQQHGDHQPVAIGAQSSPPAGATPSATPSAATWNPQGVVKVPVEAFDGASLEGTIDARLYLSGDLTLLPSLMNPPRTLFWHVVPGSCGAWAGMTEQDANDQNLAPPFYSMGEAAARIVVPAEKTHQPIALVAFDPDSGASFGCAAIPPVPNGFTVTPQIDPSVPSTCAVTRPPVPLYFPSDPEARNPPGPSLFWYGSDDLRTALPLDGVWPHVQKIFWQSVNYQGEQFPAISVTAHRLDGDAPPLTADRATSASGPGIGRSMLVAVNFPTPGCWQVNADYAGHSLSFVAWVKGSAPTVTPTVTSVATPRSTDLPFPITSLTTPSQVSTCNTSSVGQLLADFVDAFNAGDQTRLTTLFPEHDSSYFQNDVNRDQYSLFQTFAQNEFLGPESWSAGNRADLLEAFARRHAAHERWTMVSVKFGQITNNAAFIQPTFTAQADDLSLRTFQGRGVINCYQHWITTWVVSDTEVLTASLPADATPVPAEPDATPFTLPPMPQLPLVPGGRLGSTCGPQDAGALILDFVKAVDDNDQATLAALFPDVPAFVFTQADGQQWQASTRDDLLAKLAQLRQQGTWDSQRIVAASQAHGAAIQFDFNVVADDHVITALTGVGLVNCDKQQIVAWQMTASPSTTPAPAAAPTTNAPVPLAQANTIWDAVKDGTGATIDPILRPAQLPADLDTIQLRNALPGAYEVGYQGGQADLHIGAGAYNPPPVGPGGSQQQITVRGQKATLEIMDTTQPAQQVLLWWQEPGTWENSGLADPKGIFYLISAHGLTPDQVVQIANNLTALPATNGP